MRRKFLFKLFCISLLIIGVAPYEMGCNNASLKKNEKHSELKSKSTETKQQSFNTKIQIKRAPSTY